MVDHLLFKVSILKITEKTHTATFVVHNTFFDCLVLECMYKKTIDYYKGTF